MRPWTPVRTADQDSPTSARSHPFRLLREGLGDPAHFGLAPGTERINRGHAQAVVDLEQPPHRLIVRESVVRQHEERAAQVAEGLSLLEENGRYGKDAVSTHCEEVFVFDQAAYASLRKPKKFNEIGNGQPLFL